MTAARETGTTISLTKSLSYCGVPRIAWHYARRPRDPAIDGRVESLIMEVAKAGPRTGRVGWRPSSPSSWGLP